MRREWKRALKCCSVALGKWIGSGLRRIDNDVTFEKTGDRRFDEIFIVRISE